MKQLRTVSLLAGALLITPAFADHLNGPDPYTLGGTHPAHTPQDPNHAQGWSGFDTPTTAAWGGWTRGDAGTLYAEFDSFIDSSHGDANDATSIADVGYSGVTNTPYISWNAADGAWVVSPFMNVVNFMEPGLILNTRLESTLDTGPVRAVLQIEHWNVGDMETLTLNGVAATSIVNTYDEVWDRPPGPVQTRMWTYIWDLTQAPADGAYDFTIPTTTWTAVSQIAIDVAPVPVPEADTYALMLAGLGLVGWMSRRRRLWPEAG